MKVIQRIMAGALLLGLTQTCISNDSQHLANEENTLVVNTRKWSVQDSAYIDEVTNWEADRTAIIVCDMWDRHWCDGATERVAAMAPFMNKVLQAARAKGVLVVHAPSDCMEYYKAYPGRKLAMQYHDSTAAKLKGAEKLDSEKGATWPIDDTDEGCDKGEINPTVVWSRQIDLIDVEDVDAISDSGAEIIGLFKDRGIKQVVITGVHTNMCIMHRSFALRNLVRSDFDVVLTRDLTDAMYNPASWPFVSHFDGVNLMIRYIESFVAPTIESTVFTGKPPFVFDR